MTYYAAKRLTLTKSNADPKPVVERDEPFPSLAMYGQDEMKRLEAEGLVYQAPKNADAERKTVSREKVGADFTTASAE